MSSASKDWTAEHLLTALQGEAGEARRIREWFDGDAVAQASVVSMASAMASTLEQGGRLISCGNGGSMCDAMHFAEELSGRYSGDRRALDAMAISDPGHLSCVANDFGYEDVFARAVEAHGRKGDILLCFSTSGNSTNVVRAAEVAQAKGMKVHSLLGKGGGLLAPISDECIVVPATDSGRIQELHIHCVHLMIGLIERILFPGLYPRPRTT